MIESFLIFMFQYYKFSSPFRSYFKNILRLFGFWEQIEFDLRSPC